jgi:hypothetical protein
LLGENMDEMQVYWVRKHHNQNFIFISFFEILTKITDHVSESLEYSIRFSWIIWQKSPYHDWLLWCENIWFRTISKFISTQRSTHRSEGNVVSFQCLFKNNLMSKRFSNKWMYPIKAHAHFYLFIVSISVEHSIYPHKNWWPINGRIADITILRDNMPPNFHVGERTLTDKGYQGLLFCTYVSLFF